MEHKTIPLHLCAAGARDHLHRPPFWRDGGVSWALFPATERLRFDRGGGCAVDDMGVTLFFPGVRKEKHEDPNHLAKLRRYGLHREHLKERLEKVGS